MAPSENSYYVRSCLLAAITIVSVESQVYQPFPVEWTIPGMENHLGLEAMMNLRFSAPPVLKYHPPPSGFLKPHEVAQGRRQLRGRLEMERPLPSISSLRDFSRGEHMAATRKTLTSEIPPGIKE
ncbi:uncharacterized protein [Penaeus vannamei]|uniref:uncharacterized protein n=1 Tax=Penaeus vannamei TaxID=6689 RepID=UPI00387F9ECE